MSGAEALASMNRPRWRVSFAPSATRCTNYGKLCEVKMSKDKKQQKEVKKDEWPDWDELEFLPGIGYRRRSWIVGRLKKESKAKKDKPSGD